MGRTKKNKPVKMTGKQLYKGSLEFYFSHDKKNKEGERLTHIRKEIKDGKPCIIGQLAKPKSATAFAMRQADITKMKFICHYHHLGIFHKPKKR